MRKNGPIQQYTKGHSINVRNSLTAISEIVQLTLAAIAVRNG
jgi:hypothetical protein